MTIDISENNMRLIQEALATKIRLLESYIHPDEKMRMRILVFKSLKADFDELIMKF